MLRSNSQKKNLIESMKKLTQQQIHKLSQISNNPQKQKEIFNSLSASDLNKIVQNLYNDNEYLRRISALLLCELFYNNASLKSAMAQKLCMPISNGRICFNWIPDLAQKSKLDVKKCLQLMKSPVHKGRSKKYKGEDDMFCWAINLDRKHIELEFFQFKKYSSFTFLDPQRTIFGITLIQSQIEHQVPLSPATQSIQFSTKQQRKETSQDSKLVSQTQRKYSISKKMEVVRPSTGRITSRQKQYPVSSKEKSYGLLKGPQQSSITQHSNASNGTNSFINSSSAKPKLGTSIQSISQYARSSYGRQNTEREKEKERFSISYYHQSGYQTDRIGADRPDSRRSSQIESSLNKNRGTPKTPNHHENFYKRVQQILRK